MKLKEYGCHVLPNNHKVSEAKTICFPSSGEIIVKSNSFELELQSLLDHTTHHLFKSIILASNPENI